jgi:hypothetical protein
LLSTNEPVGTPEMASLYLSLLKDISSRLHGVIKQKNTIRILPQLQSYFFLGVLYKTLLGILGILYKTL